MMTAYQIGTRPHLTVQEALQKARLHVGLRHDEIATQMGDVLLVARALGLQSVVSDVQAQLSISISQPYSWDVLRSLQALDDLDPVIKAVTPQDELRELRNIAISMGCHDADTLLGITVARGHA